MDHSSTASSTTEDKPASTTTAEVESRTEVQRPVQKTSHRQQTESSHEEPKLTLTPLDSIRAGGFTMAEEDGDAPFRLEMTPPEGERAVGREASPSAAGRTWKSVESPVDRQFATTRRISLDGEGDEMKSPSVDKVGSSALEQICQDIWVKVDELLSHAHDIHSTARCAEVTQDAKEYLKIAHAILRGEWSTEEPSAADRDALLRQLPVCLDRVLK